MNCSDAKELLSAYYDGELAEDQRSRLSEHLNGCSACAKELAGFEKLSHMAGSLTKPLPPADIWSHLTQRLGQSSAGQNRPMPAGQRRPWSFSTPKLVALAATLLFAVWIGRLAYHSVFTHGEHDQFAAEFGHYLNEFQRDPPTAQRFLLAKYENQLVDPDQVVQTVGYRPAVADGLPEGYTLESTHVMTMPCCTCVQSICRRSDGSTLAIFEHDDEETTEWFGDRPETMANCGGKQCCLVELDERIAASWKRGSRSITVIGVRDVGEVSDMVAWLDENQRPVPN